MLFICIPIIFTNLTTLELFEVQFTLTSFNKIMDGLTQLESLYLNRVIFIVFILNHDQITLVFPKTLKGF
ncbi:hypothetical protein CONCODRAFT_147975 [Conidiobolus coronatus NRRL 28638]|uniref:Uncharacterized protein n=1 Tax=Conidiobolus coronatus (strain ATCC 28846 / CBS 209.66 / NRRL 28638) TaxID=796925 RepID=A0A137P936_CONC2|nr:hypothetical protein CONCODRAFT_147975 [Conidiobolus coronatus NRRL 28638]|eukprot:KXN71515.1 hypothetical protein CONCODRAFT_147975 [Conidiobolus coronatus NRRL 28638]